MIRFIDLRGQATGFRFAFWTTITDQFINIGSDWAWDSLEDLEESGRLVEVNVDRMKNLCPDWTLSEPAKEEMF